MNRSTRQLSLTLVILAATLAGCDVSFEESITPLVVNTLPPPAVFVTPGAAQTQAPLETEEAQPMTIEPVEGTPELQPMCTTDYLRLRDQPAEGGQELVTMPPGAQVQWTGEQAEGDGYTWYEVAFTDEIQGWAANQWLAAGDCGDVVVGGGNFGLIESGYITGFDWLDADSGTE
ncbi:MAG TPA: SH3 domain-containing protein, partial [Anaerolineales bacterium]|nr:SH3 domain-containing protein [Anaerolineales bacterium]